jgi:hypothetical protein
VTAIVGIVADGDVWMGADSASADDHGDAMDRADRKLFRRGEYLIGCTTSYRMIQLIRYRADLPTPWEWEQDMLAFMSTRFIDEVRDTLQAYGFAHVEHNEQSGGEFLVAFRGQLYRICSDYQVGVRADGFDAVGSGERYALGALHATAWTAAAGHGPVPELRVRLALTAAERFSSYVRRPFHIERLNAP